MPSTHTHTHTRCSESWVHGWLLLLLDVIGCITSMGTLPCVLKQDGKCELTVLNLTWGSVRPNTIFSFSCIDIEPLSFVFICQGYALSACCLRAKWTVFCLWCIHSWAHFCEHHKQNSNKFFFFTLVWGDLTNCTFLCISFVCISGCSLSGDAFFPVSHGYSCSPVHLHCVPVSVGVCMCLPVCHSVLCVIGLQRYEIFTVW